MRCTRSLLAVALALSSTFTAAAAAPAPARVIVAFKPDAAALRGTAQILAAESLTRQTERLQRRADALAAAAGRPLRTGRRVADRWQVVQADGVDSAALAARLATHPDVAWAVPDERRRALAVPNDPLYPAVSDGSRPLGPNAGQWYLRAPDATFRSAANVEAAWDRSTGNGVVIAVIDTGVRPEHPDLQGRLLPGIDTINDTSVSNDGDGADTDATDPGDWVTAAEGRSGPLAGCPEGISSWHGTQVATIAGALTNDNNGMAGTAHGARIVPVRVLGKCGGYDSDIIAGMLWAAGLERVAGVLNANPARVLNMSLGGAGACSSAYRNAVQRIQDEAGAVVVAAAGNDVGHAVGTPANCPGVIGVGGLRHAGTKVGFSDLGPEIALSAPGGNCVFDNDTQPCSYPILAGSNTGTQRAVASTWTDSIDYGVGTSFASPIVAGAAALVLAQRPALTPAEVRSVLQSTARAFPQDGATNLPLDDTPVPQCRAPDGSDQLQCYCQTGLCGTGMLDAAAAVAAADGAFARIAVLTSTPTAGMALNLDGADSLVAAGRTVAGYTWRIVNGGGIVNGFSGASNAAQASLLPSAAGQVTLSLTVTDDQGAAAVTQTTVTVAAAPTTTPPSGGGSGGGSGGSSGGGAVGGFWLLGLAAAAAALSRRR
ncbi:MAG: S8 family serine peptidase [Burkholderiaceae bacterium]|nr:S8 family serine peptidase [Burkholderiaceae bacterium]